MSNPNGLLSQKLCHCLNQGRTLNDIAYWWGPHIGWLTLTLANKIELKVMYRKRSDPNCNGQGMIKRHWRPSASKMSTSRLLRRTGCQYVGYFYYSENLNWAARNLRLGRGLDIAGLDRINIPFYYPNL